MALDVGKLATDIETKQAASETPAQTAYRHLVGNSVASIVKQHADLSSMTRLGAAGSRQKIDGVYEIAKAARDAQKIVGFDTMAQAAGIQGQKIGGVYEAAKAAREAGTILGLGTMADAAMKAYRSAGLDTASEVAMKSYKAAGLDTVSAEMREAAQKSARFHRNLVPEPLTVPRVRVVRIEVLRPEIAILEDMRAAVRARDAREAERDAEQGKKDRRNVRRLWLLGISGPTLGAALGVTFAHLPTVAHWITGLF